MVAFRGFEPGLRAPTPVRGERHCAECQRRGAQAGPTEEAVGVEGSHVLAHVASLADRWSYR